MGFPEGFWWGTASSSTQCEGAAPASDWARWEQLGRVPPSGDGNGFAIRHAEDFGLLVERRLTHHRLSIDWARVEPREGHHDTAAIEHYRQVLEAARHAGISPWVCLHHFTLPGWFSEDARGFLEERGGRYRWSRHVDFCAQAFGDLVAGWMPVNEPVAYAVEGYLTGERPPGRRSVRDFRNVLATIHRANADAVRLLAGADVPIATIHNLSPLRPADDSAEAAQATRQVDEVMWSSWSSSELVEPFDVIGFTYYSAHAVRPDGTFAPYPSGAPVGPLGYAPWSEGLGEVLERLTESLPDRPLVVAAHGVGADDDDRRSEVLRESLDVLDRALDDGIDVRGFFHWTSVDDYEWAHGFDVPFGLFDRDRNPRDSAALFGT